jgi:hypothetical protein
MLDFQNLFDGILAILAACFGWFANHVKDTMKSQEEKHQRLSDKVQSVELLVAGAYVTRAELDKVASALFIKLDRIETKLDQKADKPT